MYTTLVSFLCTERLLVRVNDTLRKKKPIESIEFLLKTCMYIIDSNQYAIEFLAYLLLFIAYFLKLMGKAESLKHVEDKLVF